ncbi:transposase family protein [Microbacterium esteraromaticum]|nr:transposase family protein [Microbacterium esteraromaticum]
MVNVTFTCPNSTAFARLGELGLEAVGQNLAPDRAVVECRLAEADPWCRRCGAEATSRGSVARWLAHEPFGHRRTSLLLRVRRFRCGSCARFWQDDTTRVAEPRGKLSRPGMSGD